MAADSSLGLASSSSTTASITPLKRTDAFSAVYRRGRWARGTALSVGILPNPSGNTRVGLRTKRGLKGAVQRNRIKRQLRALVYTPGLGLRPGLDIVIVAHPSRLPARSERLKSELFRLCKHLSILS